MKHLDSDQITRPNKLDIGSHPGLFNQGDDGSSGRLNLTQDQIYIIQGLRFITNDDKTLTLIRAKQIIRALLAELTDYDDQISKLTESISDLLLDRNSEHMASAVLHDAINFLDDRHYIDQMIPNWRNFLLVRQKT